MDKKLVACEKWEYETNDNVGNTWTSQWDLVCEKEHLKNVAEMFFLLGVATGGIISGYLSDKFGRKTMLFISAVLQTIFGECLSRHKGHFIPLAHTHTPLATSYISLNIRKSHRHWPWRCPPPLTVNLAMSGGQHEHIEWLSAGFVGPGCQVVVAAVVAAWLLPALLSLLIKSLTMYNWNLHSKGHY